MKIEKAQQIKIAVDNINELKWEMETAKSCVTFVGDGRGRIGYDLKNLVMGTVREVIEKHYNIKIKEAEAHLQSL